MSDILIRGMKMPNSCVECILTGLSVAVSILGAPCPRCREIIDPKVNLRVARHENCPLRTIPEHGDLVDRAEVLKAMEWTWAGKAAFKAVENVRVVVPSNKEVNKHE